MPDIKQIFNDETRRLARKEIKLAVAPLVKVILEQKQLVRELKKELAELKKALPRTEPAAPAEAVVPDDGRKVRLNAAGITRIRTKLKLTQGKFAALLGVSTHTVSTWEIGRCAPRENMKKQICQLRSIGKRELKKRLEQLEPAARESAE